MNSSVMFGVNSHEPLRRLQQPQFVSLLDDLVCEETSCLLGSSSNLEFVLPSNYVSIPNNEEGYITLRQQSAHSRMSDDQQPLSTKKWHHKAIRRNISKTKALVLFVGGLKCNLPPSQYVAYATQCAKIEKRSSIGPIFPTLGCFFVTFLSGTSCSQALKLFRLTRFSGLLPELCLLPFISMPAHTGEKHYDPLLVFINGRSGGGQGSQLADMMSQILNPYQLFRMEKGGAVPGLFAFRKLPRFRILVCGGDGTVGWVLSQLQEVQRHLVCPNPPMAVLPLGTGNDLARVLGFGSGWEGGNVSGVLAQVHDSVPVQLDRWNIMFDSAVQDVNSPDPLLLSDAISFSEKKSAFFGTVSPVNVVMSIGGIDPNSLHSDQKAGARNLVNSRLPIVVENKDEATTTEAKKKDADSLDAECGTCTITDNPAIKLPETEKHGSEICKASTSTQQSSDCNNKHPFANENLKDDASCDMAPDEDSYADDTLRIHSVSEDTPATRVARHPRLRRTSKHRLVHILSESDLEFGPFIGADESKSQVEDEDTEWRHKISSLRLSEDTEQDSKSDTSSTGTGSTEPDAFDLEALEEERQQTNEEQLANISNDVTAPGEIDSSQHRSGRHHSVATESITTFDNPRPVEKKFSLPVTSSFTPVSESITSDSSSEIRMETMSNYFGIGIDAELTLAFHLAREENPERCTSRFRNKALYFKAGLKKMASRSVNLNNVVELEVDNTPICLPSIRGLIFLNISSWGSGSNAWGSGVSKRFQPPSFGDGMLEVIGVGGVAHMSQMYSGLRAGIRIAQGEFIRVTLKAEVAVQIDGEPWMQPPGKIVISASPLQATMLKRNKRKTKQ